MTAQVLIVEDEPAIRELLVMSLQAARFEVAVAQNAEQARSLLAQSLPQLILLDWMLPDQSGLSLLRALRAAARTQHLPIIMLTAKSMEEDKIAGLDCGADDYITKPFSPRELSSRINALLRRKAPEYGHKIFRLGPIQLDTESHTLSIDGQTTAIGQLEFKLLKFLLAHPDKVFSRTQLLDKIWGDHVFIEERTIDVHILRLRKTLGDVQNLLKTVRGVGYMLSQK